MAVQQSTRYEELKARVEALGHKLARGAFQVDGEERSGLYIVNPKTTSVLVAGDRSGDEGDVADWIVDRETDAADAKTLKPSEATADDFSSPYVAAEYERLLQLIVCAGPKDRFKAMDIRKHEGVAAAIEYLGDCVITDEPYESK